MPGTVAGTGGRRVGRDGRHHPLPPPPCRPVRRGRPRRPAGGVGLQLVEGRRRVGRLHRRRARRRPRRPPAAHRHELAAGSQVTSPSTIPASVEGTCAALAETYGLDELQPKNTISWVDERQRVVVDAQREAGLLGTAQQGAPADVASRLAVDAGLRHLAGHHHAGHRTATPRPSPAARRLPGPGRREPRGGRRADLAVRQLPRLTGVTAGGGGGRRSARQVTPGRARSGCRGRPWGG